MPSNAGRWLTDKEKEVAILRTKQSGNTDEKNFDKKQFLAALIDYKIWLSGKILEKKYIAYDQKKKSNHFFFF
jgi:hypothetical protein